MFYQFVELFSQSTEMTSSIYIEVQMEQLQNWTFGQKKFWPKFQGMAESNPSATEWSVHSAAQLGLSKDSSRTIGLARSFPQFTKLLVRLKH